MAHTCNASKNYREALSMITQQYDGLDKTWRNTTSTDRLRWKAHNSLPGAPLADRELQGAKECRGQETLSSTGTNSLIGSPTPSGQS